MNVSTEERTTLGGGCFWCLDGAFRQLGGVKDVISGYAGGTRPNPNYEQVCSGTTGHAEVVQVVFDPKEISYGDLLRVFFTIHDPTTLNRQGNDVGTQYRSVIFHHTREQEGAAKSVIAEIAEKQVWGRNKIVTEVRPLPEFYPAEDYHQDFYAKNPDYGYCRAIIDPKVSDVRKHYFSKLKPAS